MTEKKKAPKAEEDESTIRLPITYKRKCEYNGLTIHKTLKERVDQAIEEGKPESVYLNILS